MRLTSIPLLLLGCACGQLIAADPVVAVPYSVAQESRVSLAIYDQEGRMVRTLLTGEARRAGQYVAAWDGRDRYGVPVAAGTYGWKQANSTGLLAEYITNLGMNHSPSWQPGTGNHSPPQAVAIDSTGLYRIGCWNEGTYHGMKTDLQGNILWTNSRWDDGWNDYGRALALGDGSLFDIGGNGTLWGYDADDGRCFTNGDYDPRPWNIRWGTDADVTGYADSVGMDLAFDPVGHLVVVSYRARNGIRWLNPTSGAGVAQATTVTAPVSVSVAADGTVFAISQGAVVSLTRTATTPVTVVPASALTAPWRISVDPANGDLWIAENSDQAGGARHHQVKRFSRAGVLRATYGRADGRQDGAYVATDFRGIVDIAADGQGGFCVAEKWYAPRRVARFAADGSLVREWFGAQEYGIAGCPEPGDPTHAWYHVNAPDGQIGLVRCRIDLVQKSWSVIETYTDALAGSLAARSVDAPPMMFRRAGRTYMAAGSTAALWLAVYDPVARRLRPCNAAGRAYWDGSWRIPAAIRPGDGSQPSTYLWNDLDDNGVASVGEMLWNASPGGGYIEPASATIMTTPLATGFYPGPVYRPSRFTAGGTPVYGAATGSWPAWAEIEGRDYHVGDFRVAEDGSVYGNISDSFFPGWENHGRWYFNGECALNRLVKWDAQGRQVWSVGRHSPDPDHVPGSQALARTLTGLARGCIVWSDASDEEFCGAPVYTADGLWVGEIPMMSGARDDETIHGSLGNEYPSYRIETDARTGDVLFFGQTAIGGAPVFRITGWDGITTSSGTAVLPATPAALPVGSGLSAQFWDNGTWNGTPAATRTDADVYYDENGQLLPSAITGAEVSARWTGRLIARTSGECSFSIEGEKAYRTGTGPDAATLWVDGRQVLDWGTGLTENGRLVLKAGETYDIRLDASFSGVSNGIQIHLCWETAELDRRRIEGRFLLPTGSAGVRWPGGLQAQWHLDETSGSSGADASGHGTALTMTGTSWSTTGRIAGAAAFTGGSGAATAAVNVSETARTVSLWFRTSQSAGGLFSTTDGGSGSDGDIYLSGGRLVAKVANGGATETIQTARQTWNDGEWHHVVHVLGGPEGGQRLYVDGVLCAAGGLSSSSFSAQSQIRIGRAAASGTPTMSGSIDEVRIYDIALSGRAILHDLYRREVGLIAYLPLDEGAGVQTRDAAGNPMVFATLAGNAAWTSGKFAKALRIQPRAFMSTLAYADTEIQVPCTELSFALWFRTADAYARLAAVDRDSPYNFIVEPAQIELDDGKVRFRMTDGDSQTSFIWSSSGGYADNAWHHVVMTIGSAGTRMYVDGVLAGSGSATSLVYSNRYGIDLGFGRSGILDLDDARVYGRVLSAAEVAALRNLVPSNPVSPPATPAAPSVAGDNSASPVLSGSGTPGTIIRVLVDGQEVGFTTIGSAGTWSFQLFGVAPGSHQVTVTAGNSGGTSDPSPPVTVRVASADATPTVATAASATPRPVTGSTTALSVLGADDGGEAALTYTWSVSGTPPAAVAFSANGTNGAKQTTATFSGAGTYTFLVTITDGTGLSVTSTVTVVVEQTLTGMAVDPATGSVAADGALQLVASGTDQFGSPIDSVPGVTWAVVDGLGTVDTSGRYAAPAIAGSATVRASSGALHADAVLSITAPSNGGAQVGVSGGSGGGACGLGGALGLLLGCALLLLPWWSRRDARG